MVEKKLTVRPGNFSGPQPILHFCQSSLRGAAQQKQQRNEDDHTGQLKEHPTFLACRKEYLFLDLSVYFFNSKEEQLHWRTIDLKTHQTALLELSFSFTLSTHFISFNKDYSILFYSGLGDHEMDWHVCAHTLSSIKFVYLNVISASLQLTEGQRSTQLRLSTTAAASAPQGCRGARVRRT